MFPLDDAARQTNWPPGGAGLWMDLQPNGTVDVELLKWTRKGLLYLRECKRRSRIKMQFSYLHFKHPNIRTSDELSRSNSFLRSITPKTPEMKKLDRTNFFISGGLEVIDPRKKIGRESSSEIRKMLGCLKYKYENCIFIRERLVNIWSYCEAVS